MNYTATLGDLTYFINEPMSVACISYGSRLVMKKIVKIQRNSEEVQYEFARGDFLIGICFGPNDIPRFIFTALYGSGENGYECKREIVEKTTDSTYNVYSASGDMTGTLNEIQEHYSYLQPKFLSAYFAEHGA